MRKQNLEVIAEGIDSKQLFDSHFVLMCATICKACRYVANMTDQFRTGLVSICARFITMKFDEKFLSTTLQYVINVKLNHAKVLAL